ncbi:MAG: FkbM family methyltransferase [Solirubrobacteraceae bacterium]
MALTGTYEKDVARFAEMVLRRGDTAIDVGANIGLHTLMFASLVGPEGRVHAFEPDGRIAGTLRRSLALNDLAMRVAVCEAAVGDVDGRVQLFLGGSDGLTNSTLPGWAPSTESRIVAAVTLDGTVLPVVKQELGLLKIDVEGAETAVLDGAHELLSTFPPRAVIVEVSTRVNAADVLSRLERYGYRGWDASAMPRHTGAGVGRTGFQFGNVFAVHETVSAGDSAISAR